MEFSRSSVMTTSTRKKTTKRPSATAAKQSTKGAGKTKAKAASTKPPKLKKAVVEKRKKLSALDAALKVLAESGESMNTRQLIEAMQTKGYWSSPGGLTPHGTLHSAISREIAAKGSASRFRKAERGKFLAATK
jgi:hypothetical protein